MLEDRNTAPRPALRDKEVLHHAVLAAGIVSPAAINPSGLRKILRNI